MSLHVHCTICQGEIPDHDPVFDVVYGAESKKVLVGVGDRLDVCAQCKEPLEQAVKGLQAQRGPV